MNLMEVIEELATQVCEENADYIALMDEYDPGDDPPPRDPYGWELE